MDHKFSYGQVELARDMIRVESRSGGSIIRKGTVTVSCCYTKSIVQSGVLELRGRRFELQINIWNLGEHRG